MTVIYKKDGVELKVGDVLVLTDPQDDMFYSSGIGKIFYKGICDKCTLTVKQRDWLEVYFCLNLSKDDHTVTNCEFEGEEPVEASCSEPWYEHTEYGFMRYLLSKGAVIQAARQDI